MDKMDLMDCMDGTGRYSQVLALILVMAVLGSVAGAETVLKAGAAKAVITPPPSRR
jgi:hypothetical protein